jgi:hypothetical protein
MSTAGPACTEWYFPDAYLPDTSNNISHESLCVLNLADTDARLKLTLYYEDREPLGGYLVVCPSQRTRHIRLDKLKDQYGKSIQQCVPYSIHVTSDVPIFCQYTRVDATRPSYALMTAMGLG